MKAWAVVNKQGKITHGILGDDTGVYPIFKSKKEAEEEAALAELDEEVKRAEIEIIKKGGKK